MPAKSKPWWLERGTEFCDACGHPFAYGAGTRCGGCDAPLCPLCADRDNEGEARCADCCPPDEEA